VRDGQRLRILLQGEFDLAARPALEELLLGLDPARRERVVVDIREVTFFDTTGLNIAQRFDGWGRCFSPAASRQLPTLFEYQDSQAP
jgi:hypothetical protein